MHVAFPHADLSPGDLDLEASLDKVLTLQGWKRLKTEPQLWQHSEYKALLLANAGDILLVAP